VPQEPLSKFPKQTIRELFSKNREFDADNRDLPASLKAPSRPATKPRIRVTVTIGMF
jgi:hypothetical protein